MQAPAGYLPLLLSALSLVICIFSFLFLKSYIKRRTRVKILQDQVLTGIREDVNDILKSLDETTERDITLMEEQKKVMRNMLEEIDKRLKVYIRELELRQNAENVYKELNPVSGRSSGAGRSSGPGPQAPAASLPKKDGSNQSGYPELGKNRYRINRQILPQTAKSAPDTVAEASPAFPIPSFSVKQSGESVPGAPDGFSDGNPDGISDGSADGYADGTPAAAPAPPSIGEQIRSLVRTGLSSSVIAARLGLSIAEVELAAALLERRDSQ